MKPEELGYELRHCGISFVHYEKDENNLILVIEEIDGLWGRYDGYIAFNKMGISSQKEIDELQIAYNNLRNDIDLLNIARAESIGEIAAPLLLGFAKDLKKCRGKMTREAINKELNNEKHR